MRCASGQRLRVRTLGRTRPVCDFCTARRNMQGAAPWGGSMRSGTSCQRFLEERRSRRRASAGHSCRRGRKRPELPVGRRQIASCPRSSRKAERDGIHKNIKLYKCLMALPHGRRRYHSSHVHPGPVVIKHRPSPGACASSSPAPPVSSPATRAPPCPHPCR